MEKEKHIIVQECRFRKFQGTWHSSGYSKYRLVVDRIKRDEKISKSACTRSNYNYLVATSLLSAVYGTYDDLSVLCVYIHDMFRHLYNDPSAAAYAGLGLILRSYIFPATVLSHPQTDIP
ncbi:hypothetical protein QTP88_012661 [Uroleucon formosanum]